MSGRRLVLLRHGKSAWDTDATSDHQRPLKGRGRRSARAMAAALVQSGWGPQLILSSDAVRATQTLEHVRSGGALAGSSVPARLVPELYLGGPHELYAACSDLPDHVHDLWVIGHNPGLEDCVAALTAAEVTLKTADAALIDLGVVPWSELEARAGGCRLVEVVRSRDVLGSKPDADPQPAG